MLGGMSSQKDIEKLIRGYTRRLQKLKEQQAIQGISVDPKIPLEIEDIEAKIENLQNKKNDTSNTIELGLSDTPTPSRSKVKILQNASKTSPRKIDPTIMVAVITLIGTIITAVLASPVLIALIPRTPPPTVLPQNALPSPTSEPNRPTPTLIPTIPLPLLTLSDVSIIEEKREVEGGIVRVLPIIDITVENKGQEPILVKRVEFNIQKAATFSPCGYPVLPPAAEYDVKLSPQDVSDTIPMKVSQVVASNTFERFQIAVESSEVDAATLFLVNLVLIYDETDEKLYTDAMLLLVAPDDLKGWVESCLIGKGESDMKDINEMRNILNASTSVERLQANIKELERLISESE